MKDLAKPNGLRIGLVGAGRISSSHLEAIASVRGCRLAAVVDPRKEATAPIAETERVPQFTNYSDPDLRAAVDAIVLCAPPNLHAEIATHFLCNGIHVLCEKPLALTSAEASSMTGVAQDQNRVLMMASKFRFVEDVVRAKVMIDSGALGRVLAFTNCFSSRVDMKDRWNSQRQVAGGGVLMDNGPHSVDIARFLLGPIDRVRALAAPSLQEIEVEDTVFVQLCSRGGVTGSIDLSWSVDKAGEDYVKVYGTAGTLHIGWRESRHRVSGQPEWTRFGDGYNRAAAFADQMAHFVEVIMGKSHPRIDMHDALASVQVIEAAYRALGETAWVPVGDPR